MAQVEGDDMEKSTAMKKDIECRQRAPLATPTDLEAAATKDISGAMNAILADVFVLYMKTKTSTGT
jgi:starvation-inducible DNA-binding protein